MNALLCRKCGAPRGKHQVFSYHCPDADAGFSAVDRFELTVSRLTCDEHTTADLCTRPLAVVEQEVARRVLKNVENVLECLDLSRRTYTQAQLIDALALIRRGYGI